MKRWSQFGTVLAIFLALSLDDQSNLLGADDTTQTLLRHASAKLVSSCDSLVERIRANPQYAGLAERERTEIKDHQYFEHDDKSFLALLLGCTGPGEVILVDTAKPGEPVGRLEINIPSKHARFGDFKDVNNDSVPELEVWESSGSHGMYIVFVSVYEDSLAFIRDDRGNYQFFASGGGIQVKDLDGDQVLEILLEEMIWPSDEKKVLTDQIYKWDGKVYSPAGKKKRE